MAIDPLEELKRRRGGNAIAASDPLEELKRRRAAPSAAQESPGVGFFEGVGASALGIPSAINTTISSTLGKLSRVPTGGRENVVSRYFSNVEQAGKELFRPSDERLRPTYETSAAVAQLPAEIGKYIAMRTPLGAATLGVAEAIGSRPEESEAGMLAGLARRAGATPIQQALESASQTVPGRALTSTVMSVVPDLAIRGSSRARMRPSAAAPEAVAARQPAPQAIAEPVEQLEMPLAQAAEATPPVPLVSTMPAPTPRRQPLMQPSEIEGYANYNRFSTDPVVQDRLKATASRFVSEIETPLRVTASDKAEGLYPGKKVGDLIESESFDDLRDEVAQSIGIKPEELVVKAKTGETLGRRDLLIVRNALNDVMSEEDALFKLKSDPTLAGDELAKVDFRLSQLANERASLFDAFTTQRTETGRNLAALKIAAFSNNDPVAWVARAQQLAKRPLSDTEMIAVREAAKNGDRDAFFRIAGDLQQFTAREKFNSLFKAGLLSRPSTSITNILGNTVMAGLESAKEYPAAFFDRLLSGYTGTQTKTFSALDPRNIANVSIDGAKKGAAEAKRAWRGERPSGGQFDVPREVKFDTPALNWYTQKVFRTLGAADQFFRNVALTRSLDEQARAMAQAEKLTGEAFTQRVAELVQRPTDEMSMRAIGDAELATFQDNTALARGAESLAKTLGVAGDILFPFRKTPGNIATRIYEYSPLGLASQVKRLANVVIKRDAREQRELVNALGRISVGSGAMGLGYLLASEGRMTGFFPGNQRERDEWELEGKMEGAIKVDEKSPWTQVAKYSPLGNLLQIGAAMYTMGQDLELGRSSVVDYGVGAALAPIRSVSELPMVANVKDLIEFAQKSGTQEGVEAALKIGGRTAAGMLPMASLLRGVAAGMDPIQRETRAPSVSESLKNQVRAAIPGMTQALPPRVDPLGRVAERPFGMIGSLLSPSQVREDLTREDFVRAELDRTNAVVGRIKRGKTESGQEFAAREQVVGSAIRNALAQVIARDPVYQQLGAMPAATARQILEAYNAEQEPDRQVDVSKISDDRIRARLQGQYLEQQADRVKTLFTKAGVGQQSRLPSRVRSAMGAIVR
jgi:hypothetical protein